MPRNAKISLVAYDPPPEGDKPGHLERTLKKMGGYVDAAAGLKADMVCFPEVCSGLGTPNVWVFEAIDGPTVTAIAARAKANGIWVVLPLPTMEGSTRRNSSVLIDRQGRVAGVYHKNVPTHGELDLGIIPGTETPVFETDFGRVGLTICFDLNYWEVGAALCANKAELVIWSSMWRGVRMMSRWAIEFGFYMAGVYAGAGSFIDLAGRPIASRERNLIWSGQAPLITETLDLDRRMVHHDQNTGRLINLYAKYGPTAIFAEWLNEECQLVLGSQTPGKTTDDLIAEFGIETMRDYLARVRRDRQRAWDGTYPVKK